MACKVPNTANIAAAQNSSSAVNDNTWRMQTIIRSCRPALTHHYLGEASFPAGQSQSAAGKLPDARCSDAGACTSTMQCPLMVVRILTQRIQSTNLFYSIGASAVDSITRKSDIQDDAHKLQSAAKKQVIA
jgi:hypothetical protein